MTRYGPGTALIVVDVQNDFADPAGSLYVKGGEEVIGFINGEIARAREAGAAVVFTQDWHPEITPHFQKDGGLWPVHCLGGSWGAELHRELDAGLEEPRVRKGVGGEDGYSGFTVADPATGERAPTDLERVLNERGLERVVVVGIATDYCVRATALDGVEKGYPTTVLEEGIRAVDLLPGDGDRAIEEMMRAGVSVE
ncbi:MAG: isochorismatase family protein [Actinomycetota bacterium]